MPTTATHYRSEVERVVKVRMDQMRAAVCTMIEAVGLDERQERALVGSVKQASYRAEESIAEAIREAQHRK